MDQNLLRPDLLPPTVPSLALWLLALLAMTVWIVARLSLKRHNVSIRKWFLVTLPLGTSACWTLFQLMGRYLFLQTRWHLLFVAFLSVLCIEGVSVLYRREVSTIHRRWLPRILVGCRMGAVCVLLFILLQPVLVGENTRVIRRQVVVLLDDSASMNFRDKYWTDAERLEIADALGLIPSNKPAPFSGFSEATEQRRKAVADRIAELDGLGQQKPPYDELKAFAQEGIRHWTEVADQMDELGKSLSSEHANLVAMLPRISAFVRQTLVPNIKMFEDQVGRGNVPARDLKGALTRIDGNLSYLMPIAPQLQQAGLLLRLDGFSKEEREKIFSVSDTTRSAIARRLLTEKLWNGKTAIERLQKDFDLRIYRFGSEAEPDPELKRAGVVAESNGIDDKEKAKEASFRAATDFTSALEKALTDIPYEELAGFLILTDGRHNGDAGVDAVSRRLGGSGIPIHSIIIGGSRLPSDLAIGVATAPESIFLGDKVRISGSIAATGYFNKSAKLSLYLGDDLLEEETILIKAEEYEQEFRFTHIPEEKGVVRYRLVVETPENDEFPENNEWALDVSVMDDRTNVLLVDSRPRWEFRYLRNLFYGRDKSVHLQEYLHHPDVVAGQPNEPLPPADVSRKFGDSESGSYPRNRAAWSKFDVIILGDLSEEELPPEVVSDIKYCVEQRGALLVSIAGPEAFPHAIRNPEMLSLLPIEVKPTLEKGVSSDETSFRFRLAPSGRNHPVMQQSTSSYENDQIWNDLPEMYWRHPVTNVKSGAEVLAYAEPADAPETEMFARDTAKMLDQDPGKAVEMMTKFREMQRNNALIAVRNQGRGKVLQLMTDRTWRLRYRVGDTRHHRFWGQVLRWGAGEKLRAGNQYARIGTDLLRYAPNDPVTVQARFQDTSFQALNDLKPEVFVTDSLGKEIRSIRLRYREDSNGFYEGELAPIQKPGYYKVHLRCPEAGRILGGKWPEVSEAQFVVVTSRRPAEFVKVSASWDTPRRMASVSGGLVLPPSRLGEALDRYGEGNRVMHERSEIYLWDHPLLFLLLIGLLTAEWILRKRVSLM